MSARAPARPSEAQALQVYQDVIIRQPEPAHEAAYGELGMDVYVRHHDGRFVPIGIITELQMHCAAEEALSVNGTVTLMPGMRTAHARFEGWL